MIRVILAIAVLLAALPVAASACDLFSFNAPFSQRVVVQDFGVPVFQQRIVQRFDVVDFPVRQRIVIRNRFGGGFGGNALSIRAPFFRLNRVGF